MKAPPSRKRRFGRAAAVAVAGLAVAAGLSLFAIEGFGQPAASAASGPLTTSAVATPTAASAPSAVSTPTSSAPDAIERGRYLVALGDCAACHTPGNAAPFSGGRAIETPFGNVLSANLTPDAQTGIGRYTPDTFYRALHEGRDAEGRHLYPAFPYTNYRRITREDSDAMFAYLRTLVPVSHAVDRNQLHFPFNVRVMMAVWNALYLHGDSAPPAKGTRPAEWTRGEYIVEGLGHCQACHTARDWLGGPKKDAAFQGGAFGAWFAPDITPNKRTGLGGWSRDELLEFFREGHNAQSVASGEMGEVVEFSTSMMNDADLSAVIAYLNALSPSPDQAPVAPDPAVMLQGQAIWQDACSACHRMLAQGSPRLFPALKANANLQQRDPTTVIHVILGGAQHRPTPNSPTTQSMPAFAWKLDDAQIAAVATYARSSWGNAAAAQVTASQVAALRKRLQEPAAVATPPAAASAPHDLLHPGPGTLAPANTDSRDNGSPNAGRAVP